MKKINEMNYSEFVGLINEKAIGFYKKHGFIFLKKEKIMQGHSRLEKR